MPNKTPEWVLKTPEEPRYFITMYDPADGNMQDVDIDRDEYILLKRCIAILRGHVENEEVHRAALQSLIPAEEEPEEETGEEDEPDGETNAEAQSVHTPTPEPAALSATGALDWVSYSSDNWFELSEYVGSIAEVSVDLTHEEFHALKAHLAKMRGYARSVTEIEPKP